MSWSVNVPQTPVESFADAVKSAEIQDTYNSAELLGQWNEQLQVAKAAVLAVFEQRPFGENSVYYASLGGHANHGENPSETGHTTTEFVSITIGCKPTMTTY